MYIAATDVSEFLQEPTPQAWVDAALENLDILLSDHANCEKKAASMALSMMFRYPDEREMGLQMSRFAREELRHYEQVMSLMKKLQIPYRKVSPARYASGLRPAIATHEPQRMIDTLLVSAFIEARSCERFMALAPYLEGDLKKFYQGLLNSEARHFTVYLDYARRFAEDDLEERIAELAEIESDLIVSPDKVFRFHSGVPAAL